MRTFIRALYICIFCLIGIPAGLSQKVDMVGFEQNWIDSEATIALKNRSSVPVKNVSFTLEFLDMQGNSMDYKEYSYKINIAPGKTKKLNIPAYEHSRHYQYYKSSDRGLDFPKFKVRFELNGVNGDHYNQPQTSSATENDLIREETDPVIYLALIPAFIAIGFIIGLLVLVGVVANKFHRSPLLWILLAFVCTPILTLIILAVAGRKSD